MADDTLDYLQPGFEPSSLTMPRLRSILVSHDVSYPSSAKKAQLIELFNEKVLPRRKKILAERDHARRTSKGITDADSTETPEEEDVMPEPPTPRARSTRKTSSRHKSTDESEGELPVLRRSRSPTKRTPRPSSKHARGSDSELGADFDGMRKSSRTTRRSQAPTPAVISPPSPVLPDMRSGSHEKEKDASRRESAFTYDNPFQSGSSPPPGGERKRKSLGTSASKASATKDNARRRATSTGARRRTAVPEAEADIHPPTSATFEVPVSALDGLKDYDEHGVEASEEFTPEAQLELIEERAAKGLSPPSRVKQQAKGFSMAGPLWAAFLLVLSGYAFWYRQEKLAVGFCGVGRPATQVIPAEMQVPDWLRVLAEPQCDPCPRHAYCNINMQAECENDFVLTPHPLSLNGLLPLAPTCEPDGEKVRRVQSITTRAIEALRDRRAKWECGDPLDDEGVAEPKVEIDSEALKKVVSKNKRKMMGAEEFEELWATAIGEIKKRDEVVSVADGPHLFLTSTSLARLPLLCTIRRSFRLTVARYRYQLTSLISHYRLQLTLLALLSGLALYIRNLFTSRRTTAALIPNLVSITLDRLSTQAAFHLQDPDAYHEPWISIGQLRDDVLRDEHSIRKREAIWTNVRNVVEKNANVRSGQREARNGEVSRAWEWIGPVDVVGISGGERRRKSGRVSYGLTTTGVGSSPVVKEEMVQNKWEEGRPIY